MRALEALNSSNTQRLKPAALGERGSGGSGRGGSGRKVIERRRKQQRKEEISVSDYNVG